jgi:hypothetical protein
MKKEIDYKNIHILLIGVTHAIQAKGHIKWHIQKMEKKGFSEDLRKMMDAYLKNMRNELIRLCEQKNPAVVFEEGGPYDKVQGDRWKAWIHSGKTILEEKYGDKHIFVDVRMPKFFRALRNPGNRKRERAFVQGMEDYLREKSDIHNIVFVVGSAHHERVKKMLKEKGFQVEARNIDEEFKTEELRQKVKEEAKRLKKERFREKKKPFWIFWG